MKLRAEKKLANYLKGVFSDLERDSDLTRALRRISIKEVHLRRNCDEEALKVLKKTRRLIY